VPRFHESLLPYSPDLSVKVPINAVTGQLGHLRDCDSVTTHSETWVFILLAHLSNLKLESIGKKYFW
jgi:hypothetical protein